MKEIELSVVMPCLNEEKTIRIVVEKALRAMKENSITGEVVVSDNGSSDNSVELANKAGARVVHAPEKGYGNALRYGFSQAKGKYLLMADSDDTYDFLELPKFVEPLRKGADFVMGTRLKGKILPGAMPPLHQYIGNPGLTAFLNFLFGTRISDSHCGMRAMTKEAYSRMNLKTTGMEFASEMVIKAGELKLKIREVPITYYPREGESKLRSFRDGWRHVRFMLLYSPINLFLIPGFVMFYSGALMMGLLLNGPIKIFGLMLQIQPMFIGSLLMILGYQTVLFGVFTRVYRHTHKLDGNDKFAEYIYATLPLEKGLLAGTVIAAVGLAINAYILFRWIQSGFGLVPDVRFGIAGFTLILLGAQTVFSSFFMSILGLRQR